MFCVAFKKKCVAFNGHNLFGDIFKTTNGLLFVEREWKRMKKVKGIDKKMKKKVV